MDFLEKWLVRFMGSRSLALSYLVAIVIIAMAITKPKKPPTPGGMGRLNRLLKYL